MDLDYPQAALAVFALVVGTTLVVAGATSATAFGPYNAGWDGGSDLRGEAAAVGAEAEPIRDVGAYDDADPEQTVAVVLSPDRPYTDAEADRIARFVREGGTLVVADAFGPHGNDLLASVDADARIDGRQLRDERHYYRSPALPVATNVSTHSLVSDVDELTLNHGSAVRPNGADVLVASSEYAYLDANGNRRLDGTETMASYPVATVEEVGDGRVIVVGDPSVLINAMLERPGNRAFARSLLAGHETALLDYSTAGGFPPLAHAVLVLRESALLQLVVGIALVAAVAAWGRGEVPLPDRTQGVGRTRSDGVSTGRIAVDPEAVVDRLVEDRPDLDRERLERLVTTRTDGSSRDAADPDGRTDVE